LKSDTTESRRALIRKLVHRVILKPGTLTIEIHRSAFVAELIPESTLSTQEPEDTVISIEYPISMRRRGVEMRIVITNAVDRHRQPDPALTQLILRANRYLTILNDGQGMTLSDVAAIEALELSEVSRILPLAFLSPAIVDSILTGTQPVTLTAQRLSRLTDVPASWRQQAELLAQA
jgi:site-specific DNA recombinase